MNRFTREANRCTREANRCTREANRCTREANRFIRVADRSQHRWSCLTLLLPLLAPVAEAATPSIEGMLDARGALSVPAGFAGSIDPAGHVLISVPGEAPRFAKPGEAVDKVAVAGLVDALTIEGANVYIGGQFRAVDGTLVNRIARWNGSRWFALGSGIDLAAGDGIYAIAEVAGKVYAGGHFARAGGVAVNNIAVWDGRSWAPLASATGEGVESTADIPPVVNAIVGYQDEIYVGGRFERAGGQSVGSLARWNGTRWSSVGANLSGYARVDALAVFRSELYVGGTFDAIGGMAAAAIARWNGRDWAAVGAGIESPVVRMVIADNRLVIAARTSIQTWNGDYLGVNARLPILLIFSAITDIAVHGADIFIEGYLVGHPLSFRASNAHWDGTQWTPFSSGAVGRLLMDGGALSVNAADLRSSGAPALISRSPEGVAGNQPSGQVRLSRNGQRLVYSSAASNLVTRPAAGGAIYFTDRATAVTTRISDLVATVAPGVVQTFANPAISADGNTVAMDGSAGQVYAVRDGQAQLVSRSAGAVVGNGASTHAWLSGDGQRVAFDSSASNLTASAGNGSIADVFIKDLATGAVELVSVGADGSPANGPSHAPWGADVDGRVAFVSTASNLTVGMDGEAGVAQIFLNQNTGTGRGAIVVSRNPATGALGNAASREVRLTPDGRFGVFVSAANNLVAGDTNGADDVFLFELNGGTITRLERVSVGSVGNQANGSSAHPSISDDGARVAFDSAASNLVLVDRNDARDVFFKQLTTGELRRQSASLDGLPPAQQSLDAELSGDGLGIGFVSAAGNIAALDSNAANDVFWAPFRDPPTSNGLGVDEPGMASFALPAPSPAFPSCPAGYFIATIDDGPDVGISPGLYGLAVTLDGGNSQRLEGGLNFGGLLDAGQEGFAGFNINNANNEPQRLDIHLTGHPSASLSGSLPVRIRVVRQPAAGVNITVYERTTTLTMAQPFIDSVVVEPGFHVATVLPTGLAPAAVAGVADGQFYFQLGTSYVDRPGGGFFGGAVIGGYHDRHPFNGVSGFAAFCLASPQTVSLKSYAAPSYGAAAAHDLRLKLLDVQRQELLSLPQ